ncbi:MAG: hypothetical protein EZS28_034143 [Streblomastix strix]|uniref:Uncharacterized protein n=1 Tax=Streblomastix strix TaxID=222440 RepID=A0A5J4UJW6_9EUKA|nr:MAG: hypothetical protein EZS28_034143 [Streblomastix strix]
MQECVQMMNEDQSGLYSSKEEILEALRSAHDEVLFMDEDKEKIKEAMRSNFEREKDRWKDKQLQREKEMDQIIERERSALREKQYEMKKQMEKQIRERTSDIAEQAETELAKILDEYKTRNEEMKKKEQEQQQEQDNEIIKRIQELEQEIEALCKVTDINIDEWKQEYYQGLDQKEKTRIAY